LGFAPSIAKSEVSDHSVFSRNSNPSSIQPLGSADACARDVYSTTCLGCLFLGQRREGRSSRSSESSLNHDGPVATILLHHEIVLAEDVNIKFHLIVRDWSLRPQLRWNAPPVMHDIDRYVCSVVLDHPHQARRSCPCKTDRGRHLKRISLLFEIGRCANRHATRFAGE
jgi:hypothetical protein